LWQQQEISKWAWRSRFNAQECTHFLYHLLLKEWKPVSDRQWAKVKWTKEKPYAPPGNYGTDSLPMEVSHKVILVCYLGINKRKIVNLSSIKTTIQNVLRIFIQSFTHTKKINEIAQAKHPSQSDGKLLAGIWKTHIRKISKQ
jgi:hypothetical protein